jgi:hypothetical protein
MVNEPLAAFAQRFWLTARPDPASALLSLNSVCGPIGPKIADRILSSLIMKSGIPGTRSGKFMGHNPFSREKDYVPNFPVMSRNSVLLSIGDFGSAFVIARSARLC